MLAATVITTWGSSIALATTTATPASERPPIPPVIWTLETIVTEAAPTPVPVPAAYTVQFLPDGTVRILADCNHGQGRYTASPPGLSITDVVMTKAACAPGSLSDTFIATLAAVATYEFQDDALVLGTDQGVRLVLKPTLTGVVWQWERFLGGRNTGAVPAEPSAYTLEFREDGSVAVQADCNSGSGRFESQPPQLLITDLAMTELACPPGSQSDAFVRNLRDVRSFVFRGGQLYLSLMADAGIMIFSAEALPEKPATPAAG
jgi:heat shock protein HslJ